MGLVVDHRLSTYEVWGWISPIYLYKNKSIGEKTQGIPTMLVLLLDLIYELWHYFYFFDWQRCLRRASNSSYKVVWNPFTFLSPPPDCRYHRAGYTTLNVYFYFCCYIEVPLGFLFSGLLDLLWGRGVKCVYVCQRTTCKCWFISPYGAQGLNSGQLVWQQMPLPTEPSH